MMDFDPGAIKENARSVVAIADRFGLGIESDEDFEAAGQFLTGTIKPARRKIDETLGQVKRKAYAAYKEALGLFQRVDGELERAERLVKAELARYSAAREAESRKTFADSVAAAEEEALSVAAELEDQGRHEDAEAALEILPGQVRPPEPPKAEGVSIRPQWDYEIVNQGAIRRAYMVPDRAKIGRVVRSVGPEAAAVVGGIKVIRKEIVSGKTK